MKFMIHNFYKRGSYHQNMETVLVIGSNSFSGSHYITLLLEKTKYNIIGISRSPEKKKAFLPYKASPEAASRFSFHQLNLNQDIPAILQLIDEHKIEYVVNFAAQSEVAPSWQNPLHWYHTNVISLVHLLSQLKDRKHLKKYVHASTPEVYGTMSGVVTEHTHYSPSTPYAASKAAADLFIQMLVKNFNFPAVSTRVANIYGPGQQLFKIIPKSVMSIKLGKKIPLHGGGHSVRAFIHARDASEGVLTIMENGKPGDIFHLTTSEFISICDLVRKICDKLGVSFEENVVITEDRVGKDAAYTLDFTKAKTELSWKPIIGLDQGINEVINWVDQNFSELKDIPLEYIHKE